MIGTGLALLGSAALGLGGSLINGLTQKKAATDASNAQTLAALGQLDLQKQGLDFTKKSFQQGLDFTKKTYAQGRADTAPWLSAGKAALTQLRAEMKLGPSKFRADPGYKFQVSEGTKGVINNLATLGMKNSGSALKALTRFRTGLADQSYTGYYGRLADLAGVGQSQANNNATQGSNVSGMVNNSLAGLSGGVSNAYQNMGNTLQDAGAYRASGYTGGANAITGMVNSGVNTLSGLAGRYAYGGGLY